MVGTNFLTEKTEYLSTVKHVYSDHAYKEVTLIMKCL